MTSLDANAVRSPVSGPRGISVAQVKVALQRHAGVFSLAARELGVSRQAVFDRVRRSPELQKLVAEIEETLLDAVDAGLADLIINKRDPATLRWYADRKGKRRGYGVETADQLQSVSTQPMRIIVEYVDADHSEVIDSPSRGVIAAPIKLDRPRW